MLAHSSGLQVHLGSARRKPLVGLLVVASVLLGGARAAQHQDHAPQAHAQRQDHAPHAIGGGHDAMRALLGPYPASREASGTSWVPDDSPMHGRHFGAGPWSFMLHGMATLVYDDQGGRRGDEDLLSTNMLMLMGSRPLGRGTLGVRGMLSLEPATMSDDGYPLLFQTGETGDGTTPLIDRQHPHDLFMELAAAYSLPLGEERSAFAYVGLPGEPALGPPTFMHRFSGMQSPEAPLGHHWLDSTHISFGVATLGAVWGAWKLDASAFNGREPDEDRWDIETEPLDSKSVRLTFNPTSRWSFQASVGDLRSPEQLEPDVDIGRSTVSAIHHRSWDENDWQTTFAAGRNDKDPGGTTEALLLESAVTFGHRDTWFGRIESVEEDELFEDGHPLADRTFRVQKLSLGYARELARVSDVSIAIGALASVYAFDDELEDEYGDHPRSFMIFLRASL